MLADAHRPRPANACACETDPPGRCAILRPPQPPACHLLELRQAQGRASPGPLPAPSRTRPDPRVTAPGAGLPPASGAPARPGAQAAPVRPGRAWARFGPTEGCGHGELARARLAMALDAGKGARGQLGLVACLVVLEVARLALRAWALLRGLDGRLRGASPHTPAPRAPGPMRPSILRLILARQYHLAAPSSMWTTSLDTRWRSYT